MNGSMRDLPAKPANPARTSPGHLATSALSALLLCLGIGLVVLGALNLDNCPKEEALPLWMVSAGSTLIVITSILLLYELCICCSCIQECHPGSLLGTTICAVFCACLTGGLMVLGILVWLGLWIAGTYFAVMAARDMRVEAETVEHREVDCDLASVVFSCVAILVMWVLFLTVFLLGSFKLCQNSRQHQKQLQQQQQKGNRRHRDHQQRYSPSHSRYDPLNQQINT